MRQVGHETHPACDTVVKHVRHQQVGNTTVMLMIAVVIMMLILITILMIMF